MLDGMAARKDAIILPVPNVLAEQVHVDKPYCGVKEHYAVARVERGRTEWWSRGRVWQSVPGSFQLQQPGDVRRDLQLSGTIVYQIISFPAQLVESVTGPIRVHPQLNAADERSVPFQRLHDAVVRGAERLALEVAISEAIASLAAVGDASWEHTTPVRRALERLRGALDEPLTLDDLAAHADLDKYHLCRAFRAQIGMPPHTYLTRLRIMRAKQLLESGVRPIEVAPHVGFYDQSQLNRHFRRLVGTTPGRYAEQHRRRWV
jgi:AraC-like DNA-binding protein